MPQPSGFQALFFLTFLDELVLLLNKPSKAQHPSVVIGNLEGPQSTACIGQFAMQLRVQRVRIIPSDIGVPARPPA